MTARTGYTLSGKRITADHVPAPMWEDLVRPSALMVATRAAKAAEIADAGEVTPPPTSRRQLRAIVRAAHRRGRRARRANVRAFIEARNTEPAPSRREQRCITAEVERRAA